jgi:hypothetical protein
MKLKVLVAAAAIAFCGAASALTGPGDLGNIDNSVVQIGASHNAGETFSDVYAFSISNIGIGLGETVNLALDLTPNLPGSTLDVAFTSVSFLDAANNVLATDTNGADGWSVVTLLPTGGSYSFVVNGLSDGNFGGKYAGVIATVVAVPEPSTYALLLAGLGALGFAARRRKQADAAEHLSSVRA